MIEVIQAQDNLQSITCISYPHLKTNAQKKIINPMQKVAYNFKERNDKLLTTTEFFKKIQNR